MPTHDPAQSRLNARDDLHELVCEWAERHPALVAEPGVLAEHVCIYVFDVLLEE